MLELFTAYRHFDTHMKFRFPALNFPGIIALMCDGLKKQQRGTTCGKLFIKCDKHEELASQISNEKNSILEGYSLYIVI